MANDSKEQLNTIKHDTKDTVDEIKHRAQAAGEAVKRGVAGDSMPLGERIASNVKEVGHKAAADIDAARVLVADGFHVQMVSDGAQALSCLLAEPYDVLVSDVCMPNMTGLELLREVRRSLPELPVVLLTGQLDAEAYGQARDLGSVRYLLKPVGMEQLARAVRSAYELRASWMRTKMRRAAT